MNLLENSQQASQEPSPVTHPRSHRLLPHHSLTLTPASSAKHYHHPEASAEQAGFFFCLFLGGFLVLGFFFLVFCLFAVFWGGLVSFHRNRRLFL